MKIVSTTHPTHKMYTDATTGIPYCGSCKFSVPTTLKLPCTGTPDSGKAPVAKEMVNHPEHYGGVDNPYEVIKVIRAWNLGFALGNAIKYIPRAGKKDPSIDKYIEDLEKSIWYIRDEINQLKKERDRAGS